MYHKIYETWESKEESMLAMKALVRKAKERLGWSINKFATHYCIPQRTIEDWIRGIRQPPTYVFNMLYSDILDLIEEMKERSC